MFVIMKVALCAGVLLVPDNSCDVFNDTAGPYKTQEECNTRLDEIRNTGPQAYMQAKGAKNVTMFLHGNICKKPSFPA